jgi:predicted KAP-like P-loop ATPase
MSSAGYLYDALISSIRQEPDISLAHWLLKKLKEDGYRIAFEEIDFLPENPFLDELERCVRESRFVLTVISPRYFEQGNPETDARISVIEEMADRDNRLIPLIYEEVEAAEGVQYPTWLYDLASMDFTNENSLEKSFERLKALMGEPLFSEAPPQDSLRFSLDDDGREVPSSIANEQAQDFSNTEQSPVQPLTTPKFNSPRERLKIFQLLANLSISQLEQIIFTLSPPPGVIPPRTAASGDRVKSFLEWVESPTGVGLETLMIVFDELTTNNSSMDLSSIGGNFLDRFQLFKVLSSLPQARFEDLLVALNPPPGIISTSAAPQGERVSELLAWSEGPTGSGLDELNHILTYIQENDSEKDKNSLEYLPNIDSDITYLEEKSNQDKIPQSITNDIPEGDDQLNIEDELTALAKVLMLRELEPPVAVGILGGWGSGKSFAMHLIHKQISVIRSQKINVEHAWGKSQDGKALSPFVGHIYQIHFNAWTYARSNLWASLMQEIFFELNRQISLEQQLKVALKKANKSDGLLDGAPYWQILYQMSPAEQEILLRDKLGEDTWKKLEELRNDHNATESLLWSALDKLREKERHKLRDTENLLKQEQVELEAKQNQIEQEFQLKKNRQSKVARWRALKARLALLFLELLQVREKDGSLPEESWQSRFALQIFRFTPKHNSNSTGSKTQSDNQTQTNTEEELQTFVSEIKNLTGSTRITPFRLQKWIKENLFFCTLFVASIFFLGLAIQDLPELLSKDSPGWAHRFWGLLGSIVILLPTGLQILTRISQWVKDYQISVNYQLEQIQKQQELEREDRFVAEGLVEKVETINKLKLKAEKLRQEVGLTANYDSLVSLMKERVDGKVYSGHLGLMEQVRRDLLDLSDRLTTLPKDASGLARFKDYFPRGPVRVVLYIDDLDRCPPNRVVEVLETVQLLLKTKLFIVILAIDDRYIARALEETYAGVLKRRGKPSGIDYLEKIIQIPYRMRPISSSNIRDYFYSQTQPRKQPGKNTPDDVSSGDNKYDQTTVQDTFRELSLGTNIDAEQSEIPIFDDKEDSELKIQSPPDTGTKQVKQIPQSQHISENTNNGINGDAEQITGHIPGETNLEAASQFSNNGEAESVEQLSLEEEIQTVGGPFDELIKEKVEEPDLDAIAEVTEFQEWELELLVDCCKHLDITPRTAKRLINIYKILKAIWDKRFKSPNPPPDRVRITIALLALSGRYPDFMRSLFEELATKFEEETDLSKKNPVLSVSLDNLTQDLQLQISSRDYHARREWRRFIGDLKRTLGSLYEGFTIYFETFQLVLSFCFVGDLGYDPDDYLSSPNSKDNA